MPPKKRAETVAQTIMIDSTSEGEIEPLATKAPAKRGSRGASSSSAPAAKPPARKPAARRKKTAAKADDIGDGEEGGDEGEDTIAVIRMTANDDTDGDELSSAPAPKTGVKKAAAKKSEPKSKATGRGKRTAAEKEEEEEVIVTAVEEPAEEEGGEAPGRTKRGGRKALAKKDDEPPAPPAVPPKKRVTKKDKGALAAKEKEGEIAETQYIPMEVDHRSDMGDDMGDDLEVAPTPTQVHQAPVKRGGAAKKVTSESIDKTRRRVVEDDEDEDDPAPHPTKDVSKVLRKSKERKEETERYEEALRKLEEKIKRLEEGRSTEAEKAMEKFRKHMDQRLADADKLISSLQDDLNAQTALAGEAKVLRKKLAAKETELKKVQSKVQDLNQIIQEHEKENQVLSVKLSAAQAQAHRSAAQVPGSAIKATAGSRGTINANCADEQWTVKSKMELYSDLTGLDIMTVKREGDNKIYDCLLTGENGSLHFRLSALEPVQSSKLKNHKAPTSSNDKYDDGEEGPEDFVFIPLLDEHRDKNVIALLPNFLKQEIIFARKNVTGFYQKISSILLKKPQRAPPERRKESEEEEIEDVTEESEEEDETMADAGED